MPDRSAVPVLGCVLALLATPAVGPSGGPLAGGSPLAAQEPVDREMIERIREEASASSRVVETYDLLTNRVGPRLTNSPAFHRAVDLMEARLREFGIPEVHREGWEFGPGWTLEDLTLEMIAPRYFPLIGYPEGWSPSTDGVLEGTPVYVGDWTAEEVRARADELKGRIVLATTPQPDFIRTDRMQPTRQEGPVETGAPSYPRPEAPGGRRELDELMHEVGAGVVLRPSAGAHGTLFVTGSGNRRGESVPTVVLAGEHYNHLVRMIQHGEPLELRVGVDARMHDTTTAYNVIAEIPGTDPEVGDEVVMAGGHLDSWHSATGGTDNADGIATVTEALRILHSLDAEPRRTIRIALWGGEEQGLHGSREWVRRHLEGPDNAEAREKFSVYFNQDIGYGPIYGVYLQENEAAAPVLDPWIEALSEDGARKNVMARIGSSDHMPFDRLGVPGFSTIQEYSDYDTRTHHTNADFYERVSPEGLRQSAVVMATLLWHAAQREGRFPRRGEGGGR